MEGRKPWFLVMGAADANRPGSQWLRAGAASRGKVVVRPVVWQGWLALIAFVVTLVTVPVAIWVGLYLFGVIGLTTAILSTAIGCGFVVAGFVLLIRSKMSRLPPDEART